MPRSIGLVAIALLLASCGGATSTPSPSPVPSATPAAPVAVVATPSATYSPKAEGFDSKQLVQVKRNLGASAPGSIWIGAGASPDGTGVSATISDTESFTASYQVPVDRQSADVAHAIYVTPDLPPLPAGLYGESLTLVTVQPSGRSAAHMHSGIEGVLVLGGNVLVRSGGHDPVTLTKGQGFYILPKTPVQLINVGSTVARTLVYSISPDGAPFSTPVDTAP
jgi:uncharacterized RmlC-like cupin family protein